MPKVQRSRSSPENGPNPSGRNVWTQEDNALLLSERAKGLGWEEIAAKFSDRTAAGCKLHWHKLQSRSGPWTQEEVEALMRAVQECGDKFREAWKEVAVRSSNGRTWQACEKKAMEEWAYAKKT
ncbi:hypothetical protein BC937DRAFT_87345 [Endogone sp. FLAS-F59071]|nr:hypothetical protein BC937DRAFT_87345 [Endogone sp. FLAS-F59071]|eukprot:RUS23334.1 hypothetical protein BC937DRAFT_87345 [Endogone sp. FLAS-F59071]